MIFVIVMNYFILNLHLWYTYSLLVIGYISFLSTSFLISFMEKKNQHFEI